MIIYSSDDNNNNNINININDDTKNDATNNSNPGFCFSFLGTMFSSLLSGFDSCSRLEKNV